MYYATSPKSKTPSPFAEFRTFIITEKEIDFDRAFRTMEEILDRLEYLIPSIREARGKMKVFFKYSIEGTERNVLIDKDEAVSNLATTGLTEPKFNEFYRFVMILKQGKRPFIYNESEIRGIAEPPIPFEEWYSLVAPPEKELKHEDLWE
jgi:hypothetical protein